jgi:hypothetical protein
MSIRGRCDSGLAFAGERAVFGERLECRDRLLVLFQLLHRLVHVAVKVADLPMQAGGSVDELLSVLPRCDGLFVHLGGEAVLLQRPVRLPQPAGG